MAHLYSKQEIKDLKGKVYNNRVILEYSHMGYGSTRMFKTKCLKCGEKKTLALQPLRKCGCKKCYNAIPWVTDKNFHKVVIKVYKNNAKKRKLKFNLTLKEFKSIISNNCYYCNSPPITKVVRNRIDLLYNGVDRVNNDKGYIKNNVVPCCTLCNFGKRDMKQKDFLNWIKYIALNLKLTKGDKNV